MVDIEIIDAEILPLSAIVSTNLGAKDQYGYTKEQREQALQLLVPSLSEVVLGPGWDGHVEMLPSRSSSDTSSPSESSSSYDVDSTRRSSSTFNTPPQQENGFSEALLVRSCSQGWSLSFELQPAYPIPQLSSSTQVLVQNSAVGLNPVDWKSVSFNFGIAGFPWVLGRDVAGTVIAVGTDVKNLRVGDRVWTCADSRDSNAGGYQRFSVHNAQTVARTPDTVTDEQAATLGTGLVTAAVLLYCCFGLPLASVATQGKLERDHHSRVLSSRATKKRRTESSSETTAVEERPRFVLIYGGGAITGIYAAQLAALGGLKVICVASTSNFDYLTSLGVEACVDRNLAEDAVLARIRDIVNESQGVLSYAIDCVSSSTANVCWRALSSETDSSAKREMVCLAGNPKSAFLDSQPEHLKSLIKIHKISFSTTFYNPSLPFARSMIENVTALLTAGTLRPCRPEVLPDGLAGIRHGLEQLRDGVAPRARKLVIRVDDTPSADVTHLGVRSELGWNGAV